MNWIKNLSKQEKIIILSGAGVVGLSIFGYTCFKYWRNGEDSGPKDVVTISDEEFGLMNSSKTSPPIDDSWVTPTASNEQLVCRLINGEEDLGDESPRQSMSSKKPTENDSYNDGFDEHKPSRKILILGLEGSGKSALLSQMSNEGRDCSDYQPTTGFNVVCISFESVDLNIWEIGGQLEYRSYWKNFVVSTDLVLFTVDSSDVTKFPLAKHYLNEIITEVHDQSDFHIIATKADKESSASAEDIQTALGLDGMKVNVFKVSVKTGGAPETIGVDDIQKCCLFDN